MLLYIWDQRTPRFFDFLIPTVNRQALDDSLFSIVVVSCLTKLTEIDDPLGSSGKNTVYADAGARHPSIPPSWISTKPAPESSPKQSTGMVPVTALRPSSSSRVRQSRSAWTWRGGAAHGRRRTVRAHDPYGVVVSDGGLGKVGVTGEKSACLLAPCARARRA